MGFLPLLEPDRSIEWGAQPMRVFTFEIEELTPGEVTVTATFGKPGPCSGNEAFRAKELQVLFTEALRAKADHHGHGKDVSEASFSLSIDRHIREAGK